MRSGRYRRVQSVQLARAYHFNEIGRVFVQPVVLALLQWHGRHAIPFRDHFPSTPVNHQGTEVSDKSHAVITPVGTTIDAIGVFPLYSEIIEFVYRGQGVR